MADPPYTSHPSCTVCKVDYLGEGKCGACLFTARLQEQNLQMATQLAEDTDALKLADVKFEELKAQIERLNEVIDILCECEFLVPDDRAGYYCNEPAVAYEAPEGRNALCYWYCEAHAPAGSERFR